MSVVLGGGSASLWWGGGSLSPVCMVSSGDFPATATSVIWIWGRVVLFIVDHGSVSFTGIYPN